MRGLVLPALVLFSLTAGAAGDFGGADCGAKIKGSSPKLVLIGDKSVAELEGKNISGFGWQVSFKFNNGQTSNHVLPNFRNGGLREAVPLLGRVDSKDASVEYKIEKEFTFSPEAGGIAYIKSESQWLKTDKENLCLNTGIRIVHLQIDLGETVSADFRKLTHAEAHYMFEGQEVVHQLATETKDGKVFLIGSFIVADDAHLVNVTYRMMYMKNGTGVAEVGPVSAVLPVPEE